MKSRRFLCYPRATYGSQYGTLAVDLTSQNAARREGQKLEMTNDDQSPLQP
jgi:hypothetical protein